MADRREEAIAKVTALVDARYGGSWEAAWLIYDRDGDDRITRPELIELLSDAGIGSVFTRGSWASGIIDAIDRNGDKVISLAEFKAAAGIE